MEEIRKMIDALRENLRKIRGNDPVSRARRASIRRRIAELEAQLTEGAE